MCFNKPRVSLFCVIPLLSLFFLGSCTHQASEGDAVHSASARLVLNNALRIHDSGFITRSIQYIDSAYEKLPNKTLTDIFQRYKFLYNIYHNDLHDQAKTLDYADTLLSLSEDSKIDRMYAEALNSKGDILFEMADYNNAYKYYYKAKTLVENNSDSCVLGNFYYRLGMVSYKQAHFDEAAYNFRSSYDYTNGCESSFENFYRSQELLDNIGLSYYNEHKNDSAIIYFIKAQSLLDHNIDKFKDKPIKGLEKAYAVINGNLASAYRVAGKMKDAEDLLQTSIAINARPGYDNMDAQLSRIKLADLYLSENNTAEAFKILSDTRVVLDTLPNAKVSLGWHDLMWKYYYKKQDANSAFAHLLAYNNLKDSLGGQNKELLETDVNERIRNLDKQFKINVLEKSAQRRKAIMIIAIIVAVMSIIIIALIIQNLFRSRKHIRILTALNAQVKEQNRKLEDLLQQLEVSHKEKDRILRVVAHDIRNPLAAISSLNSLMLEAANNYTAEQNEYMDLMKEACENALILAKEILDATGTGNAERLHKETTSISKLLNNSVDLLRFRAGEKQQLIRMEIHGELGSISLDKEKINRAIGNVIINAIKFSPERSEILIAATRANNDLLITIADKGIGIPAHLKDKIFDMFTDAKRPGTAGEKPFGLGLSITRQIITAHDGKIWFEDTSGGSGTTFFITLPYGS